tara:strand:+ start:1124 stop:1558 length:435 start_codon:yes stop_codon:yes gene_type:complete
MIEIGRLCVKIAGRDAKNKCVIVDIIDDNFVMIDGQTRRRKCNIKHLEPLDKVVKIKKNASHSDVIDVFKDLDIVIKEKKKKDKVKSKKPVKQRKSNKKKTTTEVKPSKKEKHKKEVKKEEPVTKTVKKEIKEEKKVVKKETTK